MLFLSEASPQLSLNSFPLIPEGICEELVPLRCFVVLFGQIGIPSLVVAVLLSLARGPLNLISCIDENTHILEKLL
jgi:hypothetical protein